MGLCSNCAYDDTPSVCATPDDYRAALRELMNNSE